MLRVDISWMILCVGLINLPMYTMEVKFIVCNNLKMIIGELGPVELELIFSIIMIASGMWGVEKYDITLSEYFGFP